MKIKEIHDWKLTYSEAINLQKELCRQCRFMPFKGHVRLVASADISYDRKNDRFWAAAVIWDCDKGEVVESSTAIGRSPFPYIPGLLSYREAPLILEALSILREEPDILIIDGHGYAHPRRFGIASHIGLMVDIPTIGSAKKKLVGEFNPPENAKFSISPLFHNGELIGKVIRSRTGVKPIFVSPGNNIDLESSVRCVKNVIGKYRLPEPQREAHKLCNYQRVAANKRILS